MVDDEYNVLIGTAPNGIKMYMCKADILSDYIEDYLRSHDKGGDVIEQAKHYANKKFNEYFLVHLPVGPFKGDIHGK